MPNWSPFVIVLNKQRQTITIKETSNTFTWVKCGRKYCALAILRMERSKIILIVFHCNVLTLVVFFLINKNCQSTTACDCLKRLHWQDFWTHFASNGALSNVQEPTHTSEVYEANVTITWSLCLSMELRNRKNESKRFNPNTSDEAELVAEWSWLLLQ